MLLGRTLFALSIFIFASRISLAAFCSIIFIVPLLWIISRYAGICACSPALLLELCILSSLKSVRSLCLKHDVLSFCLIGYCFPITGLSLIGFISFTSFCYLLRIVLLINGIINIYFCSLKFIQNFK